MGLRRRPRVAALLRVAYRVAYRLLQVWSFLARPHVRGVKCVVRDAGGRVLFVRHAYGDRRRWELPGGGVKRGETACEAARREAREELGADVAEWADLGEIRGTWHHRREVMGCFAARWPGGPVRPDPVEIAEARWSAPDAPPGRVGPATRDVLHLLARTFTPSGA